MSKAYSGKFEPINKEKYKGDWRKITYRSGWEKWLMAYLDRNSRVKRWGSETIVIPYYSRMDEKKRRYYMDFEVTYDTGETFMFEVKPYKETIPPIKPQRMTSKSKSRYMMEVYTYGVNMDKWKAAKEAADKHNMKFRLITENSLKQLGWKQ